MYRSMFFSSLCVFINLLVFYTVYYAYAGKMKIVEEPNTFG